MRRLALLLVTIFAVLAGCLYAYAERACPAPSWAFWTEDDNAPRINFEFAECD